MEPKADLDLQRIWSLDRIGPANMDYNTRLSFICYALSTRAHDTRVLDLWTRKTPQFSRVIYSRLYDWIKPVIERGLTL